MPVHTHDLLTLPLTHLKGVGEKLAEKLTNLNIHTIQDLLLHLPYRYEDRTKTQPIASLNVGEHALIQGGIIHVELIKHKILNCIIRDGSGQICLRFFHYVHSLKKQLSNATLMQCYGQVRLGFNGLEMIHPQWKKLIPGQINELPKTLTPIYSLTKGIQQRTLKKILDQALELLNESTNTLVEFLPTAILKSLKLPEIKPAINFLHRPTKATDYQLIENGELIEQKRLVFEEMLAHHLALKLLRQKTQSVKAKLLNGNQELITQFINSLPFQLTNAQHRVTKEIITDLRKKLPALRLVQGDVGSGKTVVAAIAALQAVTSGSQVAIMAPTELLAEQHFNTLTTWFSPFKINIAWLSSSKRGKQREIELTHIANTADIIIGTHALFQQDVNYKNLDLVIIDEQHRFGVEQRLALQNKNQSFAPHQIIMTATPIPRTLAMTMYAHLDISTIDELPPGRKPINTVAISQSKRNQVIKRVEQSMQAGNQAYWVCTLIDESDKTAALAATETAKELETILPNVTIGLIHGKLKSAEKEEIMAQFKIGKINLLVATTVIEVGVDVPNASLMIIDNAERLGLFQLHQLRGRIGRGQKESSCVLLYKPPLSEIAKARINTLRTCHDGLEIAQKDLELRGPGEILGQRQTGAINFKITDLTKHATLLPKIYEVSKLLLEKHPTIAKKITQRWFGQSTHFFNA